MVLRSTIYANFSKHISFLAYYLKIKFGGTGSKANNLFIIIENIILGNCWKTLHLRAVSTSLAYNKVKLHTMIDCIVSNHCLSGILTNWFVPDQYSSVQSSYVHKIFYKLTVLCRCYLS